MQKGYSIHIGLKYVAANKYHGWNGPCLSCESDAEAMRRIALKQGFSDAILLLTENAVLSEVESQIIALSDKAQAGDLVLITFSGHGGQLWDDNQDEADHKDEAWFLYDGIVIDDGMFDLLARFQKGVRVLVIADSCHSGTSIKDNDLIRKHELVFPKVKPDQRTLKASVILLASTKDESPSKAGKMYSLFTKTLLQLWDEGNFTGTYRTFFERLKQLMPFSQQPQSLVLGENNTAFDTEQPFSI